MKKGNAVRAARAKIDELLGAKRGVSRLHKIQLKRRRDLLDELAPARRERMATLTLQWIDLVVQPKRVTEPKSPRRARSDGESTTIVAKDADRRAKGPWFRDHTSRVAVERDGFRVVTFDAAKRAKKAGSSEYVLFEGNVVVDGTLNLGSGVRSIYVVLGDLTARRIELGDAVLVVRGTVSATEYVFTPRNEGVFAVHGEQRPEKQLRHLKTPLYLAYDARARGHRLFAGSTTKLVEVPIANVDDGACCRRDDDEIVIDPKRALRRLRSGAGLVGGSHDPAALARRKV